MFPVLPTAPVIVTHLIDDRSPHGLTCCGGVWPGDIHQARHVPRYLCPACSKAALRG